MVAEFRAFLMIGTRLRRLHDRPLYSWATTRETLYAVGQSGLSPPGLKKSGGVLIPLLAM